MLGEECVIIRYGYLEKVMTLLRYILFLICVLCGVAAQAQVKIHGKVTDADNNPLEFVTVRVAGTATGTTTGLEGNYQLSAAAAGHYQARVYLHRLQGGRATTD